MLRPRPPSAVARFVVARRVHAKEDVALRTRPYVIQECGKARSPACANLDAPGTVVSEFRMPWIRAALIHPNPCTIFGGADVRSALAMEIVATDATAGLAQTRS